MSDARNSTFAFCSAWNSHRLNRIYRDSTSTLSHSSLSPEFRVVIFCYRLIQYLTRRCWSEILNAHPASRWGGRSHHLNCWYVSIHLCTNFSTSLVENFGNDVRICLGTTPIILTNVFSSVIVAMPLHRRSNVISCEKHFLMNILCNNSEKFHTSISTDVRAADDIVSGYYLLINQIVLEMFWVGFSNHKMRN